MQGWIKFHRKIIDNEIWHDVTTFRLFTLLILKAAHKDGVKIKGIELKRGQYLRSYSKLAEDLEFKEGRGFKKVSKSTIERSVKKLVSEGMVTVNETDYGTVFTIMKYQEYQGLDDNSETLNRTDSETLTERTQNEVGTNPEQEQELKNLRIKELYKDDDHTRVNPFRFFEQEGFGTISSFTADRLGDLIDSYSEDSVLSAMKQAVLHGARNLKYVEAVLKNPNSIRGGNSGKKVQQHSGRNGSLERKDSITGNQTGWIRPNRKTV